MLADDWNGSLADEDAVALESVLHVRGRPALRVIGDRLESLEHHPGSEFWRDLIGDYEDRIVAATAATGAVIVSWFTSGNPPWVQGTAWLTAPNRVVTNRHVLMSGRPESHLVASTSDGSAPKIKSGIELYLDFTHDHRAPGVQTRRCAFQPIVDGRFSRSWTAFQTNVDAASDHRGRRFNVIVDDPASRG